MAEHVRVAFQTQPWRVCAMAFALVAIFALAAACGGDDEPAPEPPPRPEPAAAAEQAQADEPAEQADQTAAQADEPAEQAADQADQTAEQAADQADQTAEQAEPAEQAGPPGPVDIAVDGVTVGELLAMLSTAEVSCVQNQVGPAINAALNISVTTGMASGPIAAPIFSCVSDETATRVAVVLIVADVGLSAETADCIGGVLAATPAPLFPVAAEAAEGMLACMTEDEAGRAEAVFEIAPEEEAEPEEPEAAAEPQEEAEPEEPEAEAGTAAPGGVTVGEILAMLSTDEVGCVQAQVGPAINAAQGIMVTTAMASGPIAAPIFGCVSPESGAQIAVALIVAEVGLSAETAACVGGILAASPGPIFPLAIEAAQEMLACMTEDEAARAHDALGVAADGEAAPEEPEAATEIAAPGGLTVGEILSMLSPAEVSCVQNQVGPAINAAQGIMVTTAMASGPIAAPIFGCVSPESGAQIAVALIVAEVGLSAETAACVGGVLAASPAPIFPLAAEAAQEMLACMTDDEAARAQTALGGG